MKRPSRQFDSRPRLGFTLVELLVVMAIFVLLATLSIGAWRGNENDRIGSAAATFKNALEGARSRAVKAKDVRGLRLITDPSNPRIVTSVAYVGAPAYDEGTLEIGTIDASTNRFSVTRDGTGVWGPLGDYSGGRHLIKQGSRIEIPSYSGNWFTVFQAPTSNADDTITLSGFYQPSTWNVSGFVATPAAGIPYRLQLEPALLPGDPVQLGAKVCIDLDGSKLPRSWRPTSASAGASYSQRMDILFSPRGEVLGDMKGEGIAHFRIANIADLIVTNITGRPVQYSSPGPVVPADPEHGHKAVSLFTNTGTILITEIDPTISGTESAGFNNDLASRPFWYATHGKEAR